MSFATRSALAAAALAAALVPAGASGAAEPREILLTDERLEVTMRDGTICRATRAQAADADASGWTVRLIGCPHAVAARVDLDPRRNPVRFVVEEAFTALGAAQALRAVGTVRVIDASGRVHDFVSPPFDLTP
ncbi:MAG: hypothetical protein JJU40_04155 [Rhodobacteraceae bacterium]|nr:hypothetical protein [Paracoccaceae bacterium]